MFEAPCKSGIYMIRNQITGRCYIGSAINLSRREREHFTMLVGGRHHSARLQNSFDKHGRDAFTFFVLAYVPETAALLGAEQKYMDSYQSADQRYGYNICRTAGSNRGRTVGPETREKLRIAFTGRKQSAETIEKRVAPRRGKPISESHKAAVSAKNRGRIRSDVLRWAPEKLSMFKPEQIKEIRADRSGGMSFKSLAEKHGGSRSTLHSVIAGIGAMYSKV